MSGPVPTSTDALFTVIDQLWGMLTAEQVRDVEQHTPEIAAAARAVHARIWHSGPEGDWGPR